MNSDQIGGILRALLAAGGGYAAAKGMDGGTYGLITGAVVTIVTAVWSWYTNKPGTSIPPKV